MKTKARLLLAVITLMIFAAACSEEDVKINPTPVPVQGSSLVQFKVNQITVLENALANEVEIQFDKPATRDGEIVLEVATQTQGQFTTEPAVDNGKIKIAVAKGQTSAQFIFKPVNNSLLDGNKSVNFTISTVSTGFTIGSNKTLSTTLTDDESPATINFMLNIGSTRENATDGATVNLVLSHPSPGASAVELTIASTNAVYGVDYLTEPAAVNGKVSVSVEAGSDHASFKVLPLNNSIINGERLISYTITGSQGPLTIGSGVDFKLSISDDEMYGLPKSYSIVAGNGWSFKKSYEYDAQGRVSKVTTEQNSIVSTQQYHYDVAGVLTKISESDFSETLFVYDNEGRAIKSEKYKNGALKSYNIYSYDTAGNVGEVAYFNRIPSGDIVLSLVFVYLYYDNGNLYKRMVYNPDQETGELAEVSVETYDNYMEKENPFPVYELIPGKSAQPWLPTTYSYNTGDTDFSYSFTYEFDEAGRMIKRNVLKNGAVVESNRYEYY